jgi:exosortase/archaeosortase family protein
LFSFVLTPITIYAVYYLLFNFNPILIENLIIVNGLRFLFVDACIAVIAYYFFWILTMLTNDMKLAMRVKFILIGFFAIFLMNIFRIWLVIFLAVNYGFWWFNLVHLFFWRFVSGVYVALVWIFLVKYYNVKSIPVYDDFVILYRKAFIKNKKRRKN